MRVIGLISGTSVDGIDAALVDLAGEGYDLTVTLIAGLTHPYPAPLQQAILEVCAGQPITLADLADLDEAIATEFALAAQTLIDRAGPADLLASHGQTVFHRPVQPSQACQPTPALAYSLQLGRGAAIAQQVGLPAVSDFRRADTEAGGEGAPLVPMVDLCLLSHPNQRRCIQNIGGIGNVTYLPPWPRLTQPDPPPVLGWDTGPGNSLLDIAVQRLSQGRLTYDVDGGWAAQGSVCADLVATWLQHPYFHQPPPKSTGRESFGWAYFDQCYAAAQQRGLSAMDLVATLTEFTAASIAQAYQHFLPQLPDTILVCGGGSQNPVLMQRLQAHFPAIAVTTTEAAGVSATYKEAMAFAVLGYWRWHQFPGNLPAVTGARDAVVLGHLTFPAGARNPR